MLAVFYMFNKRKNSLKTPTTADISISGEVLLKQSTSIHEPVFIMAVGKDDVPKALESNYCAWNNTFYWVEDISIATNNHIVFTCREDVLATYRNEILLTNTFIEYSSNGTLDMVDPRLSPKSLVKTGSTVVSCSNVFSESLNTIVAIINNEATNNFLTCFWFDNNLMESFKDALFADSAMEILKNYFSNPLQCIVLGQTSPLKLSNTIQREIKVGSAPLGVDGYVFDSNIIQEHYYSIKIPWKYNDFRNRSPYTSLSMYLPYVGYFDIDTSKCYKSRELTILMLVEPLTGNIVYKIYADIMGGEAVELIDIRQGCCNTQIPIAQVEKTNFMQGIISSFGVAASIATKNGAGIVMAADNYIESFRQNTQTNGAVSSAIGTKVGTNIVLEVWSMDMDIPAIQTEVMGHPLFTTTTINKLTGYCKTRNFSLSALATQHELDEVNALMDGGVYIE